MALITGGNHGIGAAFARSTPGRNGWHNAAGATPGGGRAGGGGAGLVALELPQEIW
jgi:hypothetical protein